MTLTRSLVFIVPLLVHAPSAFAQAPAIPPEPPPRLEGSAQFSFIDTRGNSSTRTLGAGGDLTLRPDPWIYKAKTLFAQSDEEGDLTARSLSALFRASRMLSPRWAVYGQYDYLHDAFAGVDGRHVVEGGASFLAVDRAPHRLRFDAGLGYLHEARPDETLNSATFSAGLGYRLAISATSEFTYEPRFLVPLTDTSAWKFDHDVALTVAMNSILSLKVAQTLHYVADPPKGFEPTDSILTFSLVAKVRRPK